MSTTVGKQSARQAARREALESQARLRAGRVEREKRLSRLGVWVTAAMRERDAAIAMYEQRAAVALTQMVEDEGATWAEAADWCGDCVTPRDVTRLRRLAKTTRPTSSTTTDDTSDTNPDGEQDGGG